MSTATAPLLSYIVLSYNYERHIGRTIASIQAQSVQDFEIIVVDDASIDDSVAVIEGIDDPRIRLFVNDRNRGGAWSYNRAVEAARGEWLVNLDADDWIAADKAQVQLVAAQNDPRLDIIGTYVTSVNEAGDRHPQSAEIDLHFNRPLNLNTVDGWVGRNPLCRSSTMVRRAAHLRIGLDDPAMVRAPDYELWTRALRHGCRFAVIPEPLTFMRVTPSGVTHTDPTGTLLEMSYAMLRNLVPVAEDKALLTSLQDMIFWIGQHHHLAAMRSDDAHRLVGLFLNTPALGDYAAFRSFLAGQHDDASLARIGRRALALLTGGTAPGSVVSRLHRDIGLYIEARDYWRMQAEMLQKANEPNEAKYESDVASPTHSHDALFVEKTAPTTKSPQERTGWTLRHIANRVSSRFFPTS